MTAMRNAKRGTQSQTIDRKQAALVTARDARRYESTLSWSRSSGR